MTTIYDRLAALPRGRKGDQAVVIVEESVLEQLVRDAQASDSDLSMFSRGAASEISGISGPGFPPGPASPPNSIPVMGAGKDPRPLTTITGGAAGGAPLQIQIEGSFTADEARAAVAHQVAIVKERCKR